MEIQIHMVGWKGEIGLNYMDEEKNINKISATFMRMADLVF